MIDLNIFISKADSRQSYPIFHSQRSLSCSDYLKQLSLLKRQLNQRRVAQLSALSSLKLHAQDAYYQSTKFSKIKFVSVAILRSRGAQ